MEKHLNIRFEDKEEKIKFTNRDLKIMRNKLQQLLEKAYDMEIIEIEIPEDNCSA